MKSICKYRILNKYNLIGFISMLMILWVSWAFVSHFIEILTMDLYAPDLGVNSSEEAGEVRYDLIISILTWERYIDSAMNYMVYIFPLFSLMTVLPLCDEMRGYYSYPARFNGYKKALIKGVLHHSFIGGCLISLVFIVFFSVGAIFMIPQIDDIGGYASIFPNGFYKDHPYLFFVFMSVTIYFAIGFVFAMLGGGIAVVTCKKHDVIIIPMLLYLIDAYLIGGMFGLYKYQIFGSVCAFNTIYSTFETFIPLIPFLMIDFVFIVFGIRSRKILQ